MANKKFDVLVAGELNVDLILNQLDGFPQLGKEIVARKMLLTLGSSSAIFASNLSVLGSRVGFCGCVGRDNFAEKIINDLSSKGVDTTNIIRSDTRDTGITVAYNVEEERAMVTYPGAMSEFTADHVTDETLASATHLHISSVFLQPGLKPGLADLFERARVLGLTTSFDPQWDPAEEWDCDLQNVLPHVNVFLPNMEELKNITGEISLQECFSSLQNTLATVVVKKGREGAAMWNQGKELHQDSFLNKQVVDAIGAGDSFNAGFIHRFVQKKSLKECLEFAALCGAVNTTESGGTTAFSNYDMVRRIASEKFNYQL